MTPEAAQVWVFGVLAAVLAAAMALMLLRRQPPARGDQPEMVTLLRILEEHVKQMPQHADLSRVYERLAVVEQSMAETRGLLAGLKDMAGRTETYVRKLVEQAMEHDRKGAD